MKKVLLGSILSLITILQMFGAGKTTPDELYKSPPVGINNYMGNSCFMNAAMQALYYVPPLTHYLFSSQFQSALVNNEETVAGKYVTFLKELKNSPNAIETNHAKAFRDFITCRAMQSTTLNEIQQVPAIIQRLRGNAYPHEDVPPLILTPDATGLTEDQKDIYLFLHPYPSLVPFCEGQRDSNEFLIPLLDSLITVDKNHGHIQKIFGIGTKSTTQHQIITPENQSHSSESMALDNQLTLAFPQSLPQTNQVVTMEALLDRYFQREDMIKVGDSPKDDNRWKCTQCGSLVNATKKISLNPDQMPEILIVQLKRFEIIHTNWTTNPPTITVKKIPNPVPLNNDLIFKKEYFSAPATEPVHYKLISFVSHQGPYGGGHYTAFAHNPADNHWWYCDDETTEKFEPHEINKVLSAGIYPHDGDLAKKATHIFTPYLLFYQKTESPKQQMETLTTALQALKLKLAELATKLSTLQ